MQRIFNADELAFYLRINTRSLYRFLKGEWSDMPKEKIGTAKKFEWRFDLDEVLVYLEAKFNNPMVERTI